MSRLALSLLGTFQASAGERPITNFATDKVRALLAYLAVEADRPHRRDTLAALLWSDWDDSGARSNLRLALHRLREALDDADPALSDVLFGVTRETVQLHGAALQVDVARFVALLDMCETHPHRLLHLCPSCLEQLGEAAALYSGELLAGLSIADAPAFEQWELSRREELGRRVLALLYRLADAFEQLGDPGHALLFAHRQLALDPYREEAHRQVIRCYALQGERAAALAHYESARRLLLDELGVEPDPATVELAEAVRAGRLTAARAGNGRRDAFARPLLHHFPAHFTPFLGRAAEIAQLVERLASDELRTANDELRLMSSAGAPNSSLAQPRLLTLIAPGGMGKTRLAIAAAEALAERPGYADGIYFVSLAKTATPDLLPSALAAALNVNLGGAADPAAQVAAFLRPMRALLLLDNFEHLLDGVEFILRLPADAPGVRLLVTSREALNVRGEERFVLGGLADDDGAALFAAAAARVRPGYAPGPADRDAIRAIVRDVGGMPLAIELAATWMRLMDAPAVAARIRADLDFLSTTLRDLPERQRSMRAVFDYMWQTLTPPERAALAMLSVLRGPFRLDAAETITGASPEVIALLLDQSLLRAGGGGRFELHELLRQYAAAKLAADPDRETAARERHADHYLALLAHHGAVLNGPNSKMGLDALMRNLDNVRAAWGRIVVVGRPVEIASAARSLEVFYRFSGLLDEGVSSFAAAAEALAARIGRGELDVADGYPVIYELWRLEALLHELRGDGAAALERLGWARDGWAARGDRGQLSALLSDMGYVNVRRSHFEEARRVLDEALRLARELNQDGLIASALHNLGNITTWTGDFESGRVLLQESIERYRAAGERRWLLGAMNDLSVAYTYAGDVENARALLRQSLTLAESYGDQPAIAHSVANLGAIALDEGDLDEAELFSRRAMTVAQDIGDRLMLCVSVGNLGHIALERGEKAMAMRFYRDAAVLCREAGYFFMLIEVVVGLAALAVGDAAARDASAAGHWLAAVQAWQTQSGAINEMVYLRGLRQRTEALLREALGERFAAVWAEGLTMPLETAADEATAWAMERGLVG